VQVCGKATIQWKIARPALTKQKQRLRGQKSSQLNATPADGWLHVITKTGVAWNAKRKAGALKRKKGGVQLTSHPPLKKNMGVKTLRSSE